MLISLTSAGSTKPNEEHELAHAAAPGQTRNSELHLHLCVAYGGPGVVAEVIGRVWALNECHIPLQLEVLSARPLQALVDSAGVASASVDEFGADSCHDKSSCVPVPLPVLGCTQNGDFNK